MISEQTKEYYQLGKKNDVRESAKRLRRQFLRYKDAEIVYSIQHKKLLEILVLEASGWIISQLIQNVHISKCESNPKKREPQMIIWSVFNLKLKRSQRRSYCIIQMTVLSYSYSRLNHNRR